MKIICSLFAIITFFSSFAGFSVQAAEKVTLHLQWFHQFQFAGYYAALEKGFYRNEGLQVSIIEGGPGTETFREVSSASGRYGTAHASGVLQYYAENRNIVALASIFQHSPNALLVRADSGISTPHDLNSDRTQIWPGGHVELSAMLLNEGVDPQPFLKMPIGNNVKDLIDGKVDVIDGYVTNEAYTIRQAGVPLKIIWPKNYGIDFYGDTLITSLLELDQHPERVQAFRRASLRGWEYALNHKQEISDLIINKYGSKKTSAHLLFEGNKIQKLVAHPGVEIGYMNPGRWQSMSETLVKTDLVQPGSFQNRLLYDPGAPMDVIVFIGGTDYPPYGFIQDGIPVGANVDFLTALGEVLGRPVEVRLYQWADAQSRFNRGEGHALAIGTFSPNRKKLYHFTESTFTFEFMLFTTSQRIERLENLDLSNKRIAVTRGSYPQIILKNGYPEAEIVLVDNMADGFRMLSKGEVDATIEDKLVGIDTLTRNSFQGINMLEKPLATRSAHIPVLKENTALLGELNQAISKLKSTGKIREISRLWLSGPVSFITDDEKNAAVVGAAITLAIVAILAILLFLNISKRNRERVMSEGQLKSSLAEKEVLLKEIHHRVKNNLQIISQMLSLQARSGSNKEASKALMDSERRIRVMANVHEHLYQSDDLTRVESRNYLKSIISDISKSLLEDNGRVLFKEDIEQIIIDVDVATIIGQLTSEMLSNAIKHAFPDDRSGTVIISLKRLEGEDVELSIIDDGIGLPEGMNIAESKTLGLQLIETLTTMIQGELLVGNSPGTSFQIVFKCAQQ